ncbi:hypothetical protein QBC44DRAFT_386475 [Cladorrhinum sp. PSN332]|nr:hypothetical protein QBC44DRAFT_386475 [Cladorrhinum sp. PSN332]
MRFINTLLAASATAIAITTGDRTLSTVFGRTGPTPHADYAAADPQFETASGGALDPTPAAPRPGAQTTPGPDIFTFAFTNLAGEDLTTLHVLNADPSITYTPPINGIPIPGVFAKGSTYSILAPTGWAGRVAVNKAGSAITGWESLIEGSYHIPPTSNQTYPYGCVDVSYVDGYTYPIICKCRATNKFLSGCIDPKLWSQAKPCPDVGEHGACKNPYRLEKEIGHAHEWFAPCAGRAYTFSKDDDATSNGDCQSGTMDCEIHPK